jgi:single-strand DNA-binding protein
MASLNRVMLIGNLGRDPELKYTPSGQPICDFSIATTRRWKDQSDNWQEKTEWHNIKIWGKQGEIAAEYLKKGRQVFVEGHLETREWEKEGQKHYKTEVIASRFLMLGQKPAEAGGGEDYGATPANRQSAGAKPKTPPATPPPPPPPTEEYPSEEHFEDDKDMPF